MRGKSIASKVPMRGGLMDTSCENREHCFWSTMMTQCFSQKYLAFLLIVTEAEKEREEEICEEKNEETEKGGEGEICKKKKKMSKCVRR